MDRFSILKGEVGEPCHAIVPPAEKFIGRVTGIGVPSSNVSPGAYAPGLIGEQGVTGHFLSRGPEGENQLADYFRDAAGRMRLSAAMIEPTRMRMGDSLARRVFLVDVLPAGDIPAYDFTKCAYYISEDGSSVTNQRGYAEQEGNRESTLVITPLYEISSNPQIPLSQIRTNQRYNLINRVQVRAVNDLIALEELHMYQILTAVCVAENRSAPVDQNSIQDCFRTAFSCFETLDMRVGNVLMNVEDYVRVRQWLGIEEEPARILGATVHVSRRIPQGEIFLTAEPQHVGRMPIQTVVTVLPADDPRHAALGWEFLESIGMVCLNPDAVFRFTL